jgi:cytochrome d ubiquinol oxidase subunit II
VVLIAVLWAGFFVLEGFDFGVGMVEPFLGRTDEDRQVIRSTTGPFWDGNEVWLIVAAGATFAAFPDWYATMFSAYYLPLFVVLLALIFRALSFEYRDKREDRRWRATWDWLTAVACAVVPLGIGIVFGGLLAGIPINSQHTFTGSFVDLVQPYAVFCGLTFLVLCWFQGLMFLRIKTADEIRQRVDRSAAVAGGVVFVALIVFMIWTQAVARGDVVIPGPGLWLALTAAGAAGWLANHPRHAGWGFAASATAIAFVIFGFFGTLYPDLVVSSTSAANSVTKADSSSSYTLTLMSVIALVMVPVVILYSAWSYWVFRARVTAQTIAVGGDGAAPDGRGPGLRSAANPSAP